MGKSSLRRRRAKPELAVVRSTPSRRLNVRSPQASIQRFAAGTLSPDDLLTLQKTLGNERVAGLLVEAGHVPGREGSSIQPVQRQDSHEEDEVSDVEEDGGLWGHMKSAWSWFKNNMLGGGQSEGEQTTTPESGSQTDYGPQEGVEDSEDTGEWTEEFQY